MNGSNSTNSTVCTGILYTIVYWTVMDSHGGPVVEERRVGRYCQELTHAHLSKDSRQLQCDAVR